jgi:hypothetical protein
MSRAAAILNESTHTFAPLPCRPLRSARFQRRSIYTARVRLCACACVRVCGTIEAASHADELIMKSACLSCAKLTQKYAKGPFALGRAPSNFASLPVSRNYWNFSGERVEVWEQAIERASKAR